MRPANILAILGSPRKNGNSEDLCNKLIEALVPLFACETEVIRVAPKKIAPCIGCGGCDKTGMCVVKDDMIDMYEKIDRADLMFLVSPTYFYSVSAQLKAFIDRGQARWSRKYLVKERVRQTDTRRGYLLCTAATQGKKLFEGSELVAKSFFDAVDITYGGSLLIRGVDERGALRTHASAAKQISDFAADVEAIFTP